MPECEICGDVTFTNSCNECGGRFCEQHMLPENHNCPSLLNKKLSAEWFEGGDRIQKIGNAESESTDSDANKQPNREANVKKQNSSSDSKSESKEVEPDDNDSNYETVDAETVGTSKELEGNPSPDVNLDRSIASDQDDNTEEKDLLSSDNRIVAWLQSLWKRMFSVVQSTTRLAGVVAVWVGVAFTLWNFATGAENMMILQGIAIAVLGFGAVKITNTGL